MDWEVLASPKMGEEALVLGGIKPSAGDDRLSVNGADVDSGDLCSSDEGNSDDWSSDVCKGVFGSGVCRCEVDSEAKVCRGVCSIEVVCCC